MPNACFFVGLVESNPELRVKDKERRVVFDLVLDFKEELIGWIKVICLGDLAEPAAKLQLGMKIVIQGSLVRGVWEIGKEIWWDEVELIASYLEVIK